MLAPSYTQNPQLPEERSWYILHKAEYAYEQSDYVEAIQLSVEAKKIRKQESEWSLFEVTRALTPLEVQQAGEDIDLVLEVLEEREQYHVIEIILETLEIIPIQRELVTVPNVLEAIQNKAFYPEADYLLGRLYRIQGEYSVAQDYLDTAWEHSEKLDIAELENSILYEMAELQKLQGNLDAYEKALLFIISREEDELANPDSGFARSVVATLKRGVSLDDFFLLYRHNFYDLIPMYNQLAEYYYNNEEYEKALPYSVLASLSMFTRMYDAVLERNFEFEYTTYIDYLKSLVRYHDVIRWSISQEVWRGFYYFSKILEKLEITEISRELKVALARECPEDYWKQLAFKEIFTN